MRNKLSDIRSFERVILWGAGKIGKLGYKLLKRLGIEVYCVCDNNSSLWDEYLWDEIVCISPKQLKDKSEVFCFVMVGNELCGDICNQISLYGWQYLTYYELLQTDDVFVLYFGKLFNPIWPKTVTNGSDKCGLYDLGELKQNNKRIAVYTCVTGGYDAVDLEKHRLTTGLDYFFLSDTKPDSLGGWEWIDVDSIVADGIKDPVRKNRYVKINGLRLFREYDYSIYIDGNFLIVDNLKWMIDRIGDAGIALFSHPLHDCLYTEAIICIEKALDDEKIIKKQINHYIDAGMPRHFGQFECGVMVRDHRNDCCLQVMDYWWEEVEKNSYRDQISFMYSVWKSGLNASNIGCLGRNSRKAEGLFFAGSHR